MIEGRARDARMKEMQESRSMAFVRGAPPLPPAPVEEESLVIYTKIHFPLLSIAQYHRCFWE